jgi:hypothetical protein
MAGDRRNEVGQKKRSKFHVDCVVFVDDVLKHIFILNRKTARILQSLQQM